MEESIGVPVIILDKTKKKILLGERIVMALEPMVYRAEDWSLMSRLKHALKGSFWRKQELPPNL
jgi:hypothetical protein